MDFYYFLNQLYPSLLYTLRDNMAVLNQLPIPMSQSYFAVLNYSVKGALLQYRLLHNYYQTDLLPRSKLPGFF